MRNSFPKHLGELLVGLMLVLFLGAAGVSTIVTGRDTADRTKCAFNLHQIGQAFALYQSDNRGLYPRTIVDTTGDPKPTWGTPYESNNKLGGGDYTDPFSGNENAPAVNDASAAFFLLTRNEQLPLSFFVCPSTRLKPWDCEKSKHVCQDWNNWKGNDCLAKHLSYSYQNPYASDAAVNNGFQLLHPDPTFAVASDMNPGTDAVTSVTIHSDPEQMRAANSLNHHREGQNVLYGDGHVEWQSNPFCGDHHDNIFTAGGPELDEPGRGTARVVASPTCATDSILLPTAADIGYKGPPPVKVLAPAEIEQLDKDVQGTYTAEIPGHAHRHAVLTIDAKTLKCVAGPATILFDYEVTSADDGELQLHLTAPDTKGTATLSLDGDALAVEMSGEFAFNYAWHRVISTTRP